MRIRILDSALEDLDPQEVWLKRTRYGMTGGRANRESRRSSELDLD